MSIIAQLHEHVGGGPDTADAGELARPDSANCARVRVESDRVPSCPGTILFDSFHLLESASA